MYQTGRFKKKSIRQMNFTGGRNNPRQSFANAQAICRVFRIADHSRKHTVLSCRS